MSPKTQGLRDHEWYIAELYYYDDGSACKNFASPFSTELSNHNDFNVIIITIIINETKAC